LRYAQLGLYQLGPGPGDAKASGAVLVINTGIAGASRATKSVALKVL